MKKQILLIIFPIITIVAGLYLAINHNAFDFLIPITLTSMFSTYFLCYMENKVNFLGMGLYILALIISYLLTFHLVPSYGELRFVAMQIMSVLFVIMGSLSGVLLRYRIHRYEKQKEKNKTEESIF